MKIVVGIKHVPDTETKIKLAGSGQGIDETGVKWIISPYDEYAVEQALLIKQAAGETGGDSEVIAVTAGREGAQASLRQALAMGADRAVLVEDQRLERCDGLTRARVLAAVVRAEGAELVLLGKYGVGTDEAQTGPMLAEVLDWPHATELHRFEVVDGNFSGRREVEGAVEVIEGRLPAVITCEKGLNRPRYASLKGIMQAKRKPVDRKSVADVGLDDAPLAAPMLVWEGIELPPPRGGGKMIEGAPAEAAAELVRLLREEAKVI